MVIEKHHIFSNLNEFFVFRMPEALIGWPGAAIPVGFMHQRFGTRWVPDLLQIAIASWLRLQAEGPIVCI
jgi:hypothetical protein